MPSSISRSSALLFFFGELLLDRGPGAERLGSTGEAADLDEDVVAGGNPDLERIAGREPQLVDSLDVSRIRDGDPQRSVVERVRYRHQTLEHVERNRGFPPRR